MDWQEIKKRIRKFGVFRFSLFASLFLHLTIYTGYLVATYVTPTEQEPVDISDMEIDFEEIPPELIGGDTTPAPVEKQEWVEGSSKDPGKDAEEKDDLNPNKLSGDGTDKDGFLFSYNGDKPPTPIIDFDLGDYFPQSAKSAGITSKTVILEVQIDEKGQLQGAKIMGGKVGHGFDAAALQIVRRARFTPGYLDGKPTRMAHRLPVNFTLED